MRIEFSALSTYLKLSDAFIVFDSPSAVCQLKLRSSSETAPSRQFTPNSYILKSTGESWRNGCELEPRAKRGSTGVRSQERGLHRRDAASILICRIGWCPERRRRKIREPRVCRRRRQAYKACKGSSEIGRDIIEHTRPPCWNG